MSADSAYGQVIRLPRRPSVRSHSDIPGHGLAMLRDVLSARSLDISATAFVLVQLGQSGRPVLWVQDRMSRQENGRLYGVGLALLAINAPILQVTVNHPCDALWAMEEGAACGGLSAVVGEIHGAPAVLDFTATKRLAMRSEAAGIPVWLIRSGDPGTLSAARERWRIGAVPSLPNPDDPRAPGAPRWEAELFRARGRATGHWIAHHDTTSDSAGRLGLVPRSRDGAVASAGQPRTDVAGG